VGQRKRQRERADRHGDPCGEAEVRDGRDDDGRHQGGEGTGHDPLLEGDHGLSS
jgi:hypothetical protein